MEEQRIADRYVIQEELVPTLGARVQTATDSVSGQMVLLREFFQPDNDPGFPERFQREVDRLRSLDHPSIPRLLDNVQDENFHYLVLEYMGGGVLTTYRAQNPAGVKSRAETWTNSLAELLEELHNQPSPYILGDFGPDDILVTSMGRLRPLVVRKELLKPPDLLDVELTQSSGDAAEIPPFFDVHRLIGLAWWMLTGTIPVVGQAQRTLDPADHPEVSATWLAGLQAALDPTHPDPPQTIEALRRLLLGQETVSSERPPKLEFDVSEVHLSKGPTGRVIRGTLRVWNSGGGELNGHCRSTQRWVRVVPNTFRGNQASLEFFIDSSFMRAAEQHKANLYLRSQNTEVNIPVQVNTAPHWLSTLPDFIAALMPFLPGTLLILAVVMVLSTAQAGALTALEDLNGGPLGETLSQELLKKKVPLGDSAPVNARVSATIALACFALCPMAVHSIFKRYPDRQKRKLLLVELAGMLVLLFWLAFLWNGQTLNHLVASHPSFKVLNMKGENLWKCLLANLVFAAWLFTPVQKRVDLALQGKDSLRSALTGVFALFLIALLGSTLFS